MIQIPTIPNYKIIPSQEKGDGDLAEQGEEGPVPGGVVIVEEVVNRKIRSRSRSASGDQ